MEFHGSDVVVDEGFILYEKVKWLSVDWMEGIVTRKVSN